MTGQPGQRKQPHMPDHESECAAINGFPTGTMEEIRNQELIIEGNYLYDSTILIPDMKFTCSGTVVRVRVAGVKLTETDGNQSMKLQIWRQNMTEPVGRYFRVDEIALPSTCKMNKLTQSSSVSRMFRDIAYDCVLNHSTPVTVKSGDILGIELPPENIADFELYSLTECMVSNLIFKHNLPSAIDLHSGDVKYDIVAQPLIRIILNGIGRLP